VVAQPAKTETATAPAETLRTIRASIDFSFLYFEYIDFKEWGMQLCRAWIGAFNRDTAKDTFHTASLPACRVVGGEKRSKE
jgi:hypothetical protein